MRTCNLISREDAVREALRLYQDARENARDFREAEDDFATLAFESQMDAFRWMVMALMALPGKDNNVPTKAQNKPLTIEQLREMDGEPVWVDFTGSVIKRESGWFILRNDLDEEVYLVGKTSVYKGYEYYGKTWLAYRRPPERQDA